jgi:hypothetical protein
MAWLSPIPLALVPTADSESFSAMKEGETGLPLAPHPGAFGVKRKFHTHEGVDLYAPEGTVVFAVETGTVVAVKPFTGPHAGPTLEHWLDTWAVFVEGPSGVVVYGEIKPWCAVGVQVDAGMPLGHVIPVLRKDKGRPRAMLHLELREHGNTADIEWLDDLHPDGLFDPTPFLLASVPRNA